MFFPMNAETVQVRIIPTHDDLDRIMEIGKVLVTWYENTPPDCRADSQEENVKLVDFSRCFFFCQCLFSFMLLSAWKYLDAFFQLLATGQGVAHSGCDSRRTIFGLVAQINSNFFE